ncbi:MAG: adenylate/guanylate cyclase domain-containing protein, partial [Nitrospinaceae bacterium]|nr:adenylate/guanylate cyclase domain-containing protein [Nitrospinaceae bacterium]
REMYAQWMPYLFVFLEMATLALALLVPNPLFTEAGLPPQVILHFNNVLPMMLLIAGTALAYSPALVLWSGVCASLFWSIGVAAAWRLPDTLTLLSEPASDIANASQFLAFVYRYNFVDVYGWIRDVVVLLFTSAILAVAVHQTRRFMREHAAAERQRGNLARYFSPNMVDELAASESAFGEAAQHEVAVLFVDIVGYTGLAQKMAPEGVMLFLREFHRRMETEVFAFGGTMDKYIGDAVMASFGAPRQGERDAADALECARGMMRTIAAWNAERATSGEEAGLPPVRIGIGLHFGLAVMGDVGSERHASFAVLGDTTNTANRLEGLTRELDVDVVASQAFLDAVRSEIKIVDRRGDVNADRRVAPPAVVARLEEERRGAVEDRRRAPRLSTDELLTGFVDAGAQALRGREGALRLWTLKADSASGQKSG